MEKPFQCAECPSSFGQRHHLERHRKTAHEKLRPFRCDECLKTYGRKDRLTDHVRRVHEGRRPHPCPVCDLAFVTKKDLYEHTVRHTRGEGIQCPICRAKFDTKLGLAVHKNHRHSGKRHSGLKRKKPTVKQCTARPSSPSKRVKKEPPSTNDIDDEGIDKLLAIAESTDQRNAESKNEPGTDAGEDEASTKTEDDNAADSPAPLLRTTVKFKTSSGRVRTAEDQPASMTYGDFRKLFGVPLETPKRIEFKKSSNEWIVAVHDNMKLPLSDGCIMAETCTDF